MAKKNRHLSFFDKLVLLVTAVFAIMLVVSAYAGYFDPRKYALMAFIGIAYPFLLLANLLLICWWLFRQHYRWAIVSLAAILLGFNTLKATVNLFGNDGDPAKTAGGLRLMTYNVHSFKKFGSDNDKQTKDKVFEVMRAQEPDVLCFQEFYLRYKGEFATVDSLKKILKMPYYYFKSAQENNYEATGMAIFSKFPIKKAAYIPFEEYGGNGSIYIDIEVDKRPLRIYNVHLKSISFASQDYEYLDKVSREINPDKQSSKRIYRMLRDAFKRRAKHVDIMKEEIKQCTSPYVVAGDFNDTPASYAVNELTKGLRNAFVEEGSGLGRTYNGKFPNFQIDYIATTKDIEIESYHVSKARLSDHFPVRADLRLK